MEGESLPLLMMLTCAVSVGYGENEEEEGLLGGLNADFIFSRCLLL